MKEMFMLIHDFKIQGEENKIHIEDNIILYIIETLSWINTYNDEELQHPNKGINYSGITYFDMNGIIQLKEILLGWRSLFEEAPVVFRLKGFYSFTTNKIEKDLYLKRKVLPQFDSLITLCEIAIKENKIIYHGGI